VIHVEELETERTHVGPTLTPDEIGVARANLRFALENCPVDGGVLAEDGCSFSRESVEALIGRLEGLGSSPDGACLSEDELKVMRAVADYALDECPIEGGLIRDDGSLVSRSDLRVYRERIGAAPLVEAR
jgi:hypothetical protein